MAYCVNCGVELDASAGECPLCNTPVLDPGVIEKYASQMIRNKNTGNGSGPFPVEKGQVETATKKDLGILLSMVALASAVTCGILNALVFPESLWSLAVIGACAVLWVFMIPAVIYRKQSVYVSLLLDGGVTGAYLYMLTFQVGDDGWFWALGLPITLLVTVTAELLTLCIRKLPRSFLTVALYLFTAVGLLCLGLEILIDLRLHDGIALRWSAVVMTVCVILDIALITMLSRRRLRNAVRRRLHF